MVEQGSALYQQKSVMKSEDWWAVWLGGFVFLLGLGPIVNLDILGWVVKTPVWIDFAKSAAPVSAGYKGMSGLTSSLLTFFFILAITTVGVIGMGGNVKKYIIGFTIIYWIVFFCMILGNNAYIAATPDKRAAFKIAWSLGLGEMGFILAMILGLVIGNFVLPLAKFLEEAAKPEWFIKTGIVILGAAIGIKTVEAAGLAGTVIVRGICAVVEAYLIYWPVVYFISRKWFKFTPEWAAPLASGISICGVSAAIATGGAIRARPVVPVILSAVIIVFVAVELLLLPPLATQLLYNEPMVAGAWMGLAVKSDGGAVASGQLVDSLILNKAAIELGIKWEKGWMLMAATTTKVFIDIFIGVWAFILAVIWTVCGLDTRRPAVDGEACAPVSAIEIWHRFPKFVIGFAATLLILLVIGLAYPGAVKAAKTGAGHANLLRTLFFALCFFSIGLITNVRKLWAEGMGRIVWVYAIALFAFILWVGLFISWLFYHGITPPLAQ
ncbi:putative sulfate exporter family transporter [Desulfomonile tiedjei]|uniref:Putative membrane protein n=1 Tax=Desulfomonile tiedjei (strain ATCC 49306 / DSM 6799 / DCB-1) TaxID=706587 RepID=I4CCV8_DESTA|nr:putative sulfate exporter family transporter [Desulfomonile tiedjei]AFM27399.1 putative membrane protein [Desulfomonile tiedjei DSM 6799]